MQETLGIDRRLDGVGQGARLLVDFLLHEMAERAQFQRGQRHVRQVQRALHRRIVTVEDAHAIAAQFGGIAFFEEDHLACGLHDRRDIGGDEVLALAYPDQQRAAHARADEAFRFGLAHHRQRIGTGQFLDGVLQRGEQVAGAAQMVMDQMRDDLGVGLRLEGVAERAQFSRCASWFSMMPLCTSATPALMCGCALASVTPPWVAQRVWPMPRVAPSCSACAACAISATARCDAPGAPARRRALQCRRNRSRGIPGA